MIKLHCTARGEFKVDVKRDGEIVSLAPWQSNLITDAGMDSLGLAGSQYGWYGLGVGSGNTPPQFSDTRLAGYLAATAASTWAGSRVDNVVTFTVVATFGLGAVVGNVAELGVLLSTPSAASTTATRALIRDGAGQPTAIPVQATDQLIVTYRLIFTVDQSISSQTITDPNTSVQYTIRAKYSPLSTLANAYGLTGNALGMWANGGTAALVGGTFNGPGVLPSGGASATVQANQHAAAALTYVPGTFTQVGGVRFGANATALDRDGVNILRVNVYSPSDNIDIEFTPPFRKPATSTATLQWRVSWARG